MDNIIKSLNSEFLESWNFTFDGVNWIHPNYCFKLTASNVKGTYMVIIDGVEIGQTPPPIKTNSGLLNLIMYDSVNYVQNYLKDKKFISNKAQGEAMAKAISEYLGFDTNLSFRLVEDQLGRMGLHPDNEYTYTLLTGYESKFEVTLMDPTDPEVNTVDYIYYHPECISFNFLRQLYPDCSIISVKIYDESNLVWTPFFGLGLPKIKEEVNKLAN